MNEISGTRAPNQKRPHAVVLLSGGMDSTTLLWHILDKGYDVLALSFDYQQRHRRELEAARDVTARAHQIFDPDVEWALIRMGDIVRFMTGSSQTSRSIPVPYGHYEEESMKKTVVPNRNMLMLSVATAAAIQRKSSLIAYAAHAGDHAIYPDCRPQFIEAMAQAIFSADWHQPQLWAPFQYLTKAEILTRGVLLSVPYELTWTCYEGAETPCGRCGTCVERAEAFQIVGVKDPLFRG
jgi:7-cyano-7-deazaguanine synthase